MVELNDLLNFILSNPRPFLTGFWLFTIGGVSGIIAATFLKSNLESREKNQEKADEIVDYEPPRKRGRPRKHQMVSWHA